MQPKKIKAQIGQISKNLDLLIEAAEFEYNDRRIFIDMSVNEFKFLIGKILKANLIRRGQKKTFDIDEDNKDILNQLYYYLIGSESFNGNLQKGIILFGNIGTGKTIIIRSFVELIEASSNKVFTKLHSKAVASYLKDKGEDYLNIRPLFIDDIGKETKVVNDFGTIKNTIPDLFALRYDFGGWTFATCNYNLKDLEEFYGLTIIDRFKEMFNFFVMEGESRRK
jgi:DNA replication protein DnaC